MKRKLPNLQAKHLVLPNKYRIGDAVALIGLRKWVEGQYGSISWYLEHANNVLPLLSTFVPGGMEWYDAKSAPEDAEIFDDGNLWIWNDVFYQTGFRFDWHVEPTEQRYSVVFAPLVEVDYGVERAMRMAFVEMLAVRLSQIPGSAILLPEYVNSHDLRRLSRTGATLVMEPNLRKAISLIGNCDLFIGGDTGLSHIAGCFPNVKQISLHSKEKTDTHNETEFDHLQHDREYIEAISGVAGQYRATPNKHDCRDIFFEYGGMDGKSFPVVLRAIDELLAEVNSVVSEQ